MGTYFFTSLQLTKRTVPSIRDFTEDILDLIFHSKPLTTIDLNKLIVQVSIKQASSVVKGKKMVQHRLHKSRCWESIYHVGVMVSARGHLPGRVVIYVNVFIKWLIVIAVGIEYGPIIRRYYWGLVLIILWTVREMGLILTKTVLCTGCALESNLWNGA